MALSGLTRIDGLFSGAAASPPIAAGDPDKPSVGAIQDLLRGQGQASMPTPLAADYGIFGPATSSAVDAFRGTIGLPASTVVDCATLQALVRTPAPKPVASRPYVTLALDFNWGDMTKVTLVTALLEGKGTFGALNPNTDGAGLSYGIIQWAQKPGRLHDILQAFFAADAGTFADIFGGGDAALASALLTYVGQTNGGVNSAGGPTNSQFDLTAAAWIARFEAATLHAPYQQAQMQTALQAFESSWNTLHGYAPEFTSERAVAFMLDLANQFGDTGAKSLYTATAAAGQSVAGHLAAIAAESVNRMPPQFQTGVRNRRSLFLNTPLLADTAFVASA